jgi:hypothetical protein
MWNPYQMFAVLIYKEVLLCIHTKITFMIAEIEGTVAALVLHGSKLTKIGNINQIFQFTIKKAVDLALKQVHCYIVPTALVYVTSYALHPTHKTYSTTTLF